jgi:hypothetical protein
LLYKAVILKKYLTYPSLAKEVGINSFSSLRFKDKVGFIFICCSIDLSNDLLLETNNILSFEYFSSPFK